VKWNWRGIRAVIFKDLRQLLANNMVWLPFIIIPVIFMVLMPLLLVLLPAFAPDEMNSGDLNGLMTSMPAELRQQLGTMTLTQTWVFLSANYIFMPMFLIVPLMIASIIAADGIAGEKERKTLEWLLYTPLRDGELFVAKLLVALLPAIIIEILAFFIYSLTVNIGGNYVMHRVFFPEPSWWPLVFFVGPGVSLAGLGITVLISSKAKTFMAAQQAAGMLVLPIVFLMIGQITGLFFLSQGMVWLVGMVFWAIGLVFTRIGIRTFNRSELIVRI